MSANALDKDLADELMIAKKKPRNFVIITKGPAVLGLILSKKPIKEAAALKLKKEKGGTSIVTGVVGGDGSDLVFLVLEEPSCDDQKLKKFVAEEADLSLKTRIKVVPSIVEVNELDVDLLGKPVSQPPSLGPVPEPKTGSSDTTNSSKNDQLLLQLRATLKKLGPAVEEARQTHPQEVIGFVKLLESIELKIQEQDIAAARELTLQLGGKLKDLKLQSRAPDLTDRIKELYGQIAKVPPGKKQEEVDDLIHGFNNAMAVKDFNAAGMALDQLEGFLRHTLLSDSKLQTTKEWTDSIQLDKYSQGKSLGKGAFGEAFFLDPSPELGKKAPKLVVKIPLVTMLESENAMRVKALENEVVIYEKLGDHPNLPKCLGLKAVDGKQGLVLECVQGEDLGKSLISLQKQVESGRLSVTEYWGAVQYMTTRLLSTLAHIEDSGLVHTDIKTENVMVDAESGELKVIDLGGAVRIGGDQSNVTERFAPTGERKNLTGAFDIFTTGKVAQFFRIGGDQKLAGEYAKFTDYLLNSKKELRPTAKEALAHPFLAQSLLDDQTSRDVLQRGLKKTETAPVGTGDSAGYGQVQAESLDFKQWNMSIETLLKNGELQVGKGLGVKELSSRMAETLERLDQPDAKYERFSRETAWEQKLKSAQLAQEVLNIAKSVLDELKKVAGAPKYFGNIGKLIQAKLKEIEKLRNLPAPQWTTADFAKNWREIKAEASQGFLQDRDKVLTDIKNSVEYDPVFNTLLNQQVTKPFEQRRKSLNDEQALVALNKEEELVKIKMIEKELKRLLTKSGLVGVKTAEKYFQFTDNFSGALEDFEKAAKKRDEKTFEKKKSAAQSIALKYYHNVQGKSTWFTQAGSEVADKLLVRLNDLAASIARIKSPV